MSGLLIHSVQTADSENNKVSRIDASRVPLGFSFTGVRQGDYDHFIGPKDHSIGISCVDYHVVYWDPEHEEFGYIVDGVYRG